VASSFPILWDSLPNSAVNCSKLKVKFLALALKVKSLALALRAKSLALALALKVESLALALRIKSLLTTLANFPNSLKYENVSHLTLFIKCSIFVVESFSGGNIFVLQLAVEFC